LFELAERRFSAQVRISIPVAGVAGLWMTWRMDLWSRFLDPHFWWMGAMLAVWTLFAIVVFVVEPLFEERLERAAHANPQAALDRLATLHAVLLGLAAVTIAGAVAGAHGLYF
jgi:hypothetical protein